MRIVSDITTEYFPGVITHFSKKYSNHIKTKGFYLLLQN